MNFFGADYKYIIIEIQQCDQNYGSSEPCKKQKQH